MANTCFTKLSQTIIKARLASKQSVAFAFSNYMQLAINFSDGTLMTCIQHDFLATPIHFHNFPLNDDTGG